MNARDIMTNKVVSVSPDTSLAEMIRVLLDNRISGLPVVDRDGKLVGLVTEGDCLRRSETGTERKRSRWLAFFTRSETLAEEYIRAHGRKVSEVMSTDPVSVGEDTLLEEIVHLMETHRIKRLPVVSEGKVVGIVSRANLLQALASLVPNSGPTKGDDRAIREQVLAALAKLPWAADAFVNVIVRDGVVDLWGSYMAARQDEAVIVAAENVPGVRLVRNHMTWVDPVSGLVVYNPDAERSRATEPAATQT